MSPLKAAPLLLTFIRAEDGTVEYARTRYFVAERTEASLAPTPTRHRSSLIDGLRRAAQLDASLLRFGPTLP